MYYFLFLTEIGKPSRCVCVCVVSGCHVNHSGCLSLSIIASYCGNDTQPGFDMTTDEWHFTQVCVIVRASLCMCIILRVIAFSFPDVSCFESYIYKTTTFSLCVPVCVPSDNFLCVCVCVCDMLAQKVSFLILPCSFSNHSHLYFLFFSIYQLFTELKTLSSRYGWNLLLFSSYTSRVTSASIYPIPSTVAFFCFSTHCCWMCIHETWIVATFLDLSGQKLWPRHRPRMSPRVWWGGRGKEKGQQG